MDGLLEFTENGIDLEMDGAEVVMTAGAESEILLAISLKQKSYISSIDRELAGAGITTRYAKAKKSQQTREQLRASLLAALQSINRSAEMINIATRTRGYDINIGNLTMPISF